MKVRRWFSPVHWCFSRWPIFGRRSLIRCCSGRHSSSPVRSARRWVTFSPNPLRLADSISAASAPLLSSQQLLFFVFYLRGSKRVSTREDLSRASNCPTEVLHQTCTSKQNLGL